MPGGGGHYAGRAASGFRVGRYLHIVKGEPQSHIDQFIARAAAFGSRLLQLLIDIAADANRDRDASFGFRCDNKALFHGDHPLPLHYRWQTAHI